MSCGRCIPGWIRLIGWCIVLVRRLSSICGSLQPVIPVGAGQVRVLPVLVMTLTFSRFLTAMMIPSRQSGDLLAGMWQLITGVGAVSKSLIWDREAAIAPKGKPLGPVQAFAGTTATRMVIAPRRDPEFKGMTSAQQRLLRNLVLTLAAVHLAAGFQYPDRRLDH